MTSNASAGGAMIDTEKEIKKDLKAILLPSFVIIIGHHLESSKIAP